MYLQPPISDLQALIPFIFIFDSSSVLARKRNGSSNTTLTLTIALYVMATAVSELNRVARMIAVSIIIGGTSEGTLTLMMGITRDVKSYDS